MHGLPNKSDKMYSTTLILESSKNTKLLNVNFFSDLKPNVKSPKYRTALSGAIISLPCAIVATPSVDYVYWTRTTSNKMIDMTKIRYSGSTTTSPSLNIDLARTSDTGVYNCHANNTVGSTKGPDLVLVVYDNTAGKIRNNFVVNL